MAGQAFEAEVDQTELMLTSPLNYTGVPLKLRWEGATQISGKRRIEFTLTIAASGVAIPSGTANRISLEITAGLADAEGNVHRTKTQSLDLQLTTEALAKFSSGGLVYRGSFDAAPGEYTARIAVRDRLRGRVGSVSAPLNVSP